MSTRGRIAIALSEGGILSNWIGHDAYIEGVGAWLDKFVTSHDEALKLIIGGGEICGLYCDKIGNRQIEYYDDVEQDARWKAYANEQQLIDDCDDDVFMEYVYLFKDDTWFVYGRCCDMFVEVKQALEKIN